MTISIVVPTWNSSATLGDTLDALQGLLDAGTASVQMILTDDGSTDGTVAIASAHAVVDEVATGDHVGPSGARNRGAKLATGEVLAFLDSDDLPLAGWLEQIAEAFEADTTGLATWPATVTDGEQDTTQTWYPNRYGPDGVLALAGCFAMKTEVFAGIGGYDEQLRMGENSDLCARAVGFCRAAGLEINRLDRVTMAITFHRSASHYDRHRLEAMEHLLERDARKYRSSPSERSKAHAIAAVNAARCEEWRRARRHAWSALRARPRDLRAYARLAGTSVPTLGRRLWTLSGKRTRVSGPTGGSSPTD